MKDPLKWIDRYISWYDKKSVKEKEQYHRTAALIVAALLVAYVGFLLYIKPLL